MTEWKKAWKNTRKASARRNKSWIKRRNHRSNRRIGKALGDYSVPLNGREVS